MNKSFTLIEILVVIVVIGVLSALISVGMSSISDKANIAKSQAFANSLNNSLLISRVSEWKLNGNANDSWGSNNGTIVSATLSTSDCVSEQCYSFSGVVGSPQYINLTNTTTLDTNSKTIGVWFNVSGGDAHRTIIGRGFYNGPNDSRGYDIWLTSSNALYATVGDGTANFVNAAKSGIIVPGKWFYVTMTHDYNSTTNNLKLYINGVMHNQQNVTGYSPYTNYTSLGRESSYDYYYFQGKIDEAKYYNTALITFQIQDNYYSGLNNLLTNNEIDTREYVQRVVELRNNLAITR
jgi:prepilin-type N-terminal cleavage/methylation domain-containing protein